MYHMPLNQIGGAVVRRTFKSGGRQLTSGSRLSGDEVRSFPALNRRALIEKKYIEVFPLNTDAGTVSGGKRFVVSRGFGKFDVIEGKKLNDDALDKDTARVLALSGKN